MIAPVVPTSTTAASRTIELVPRSVRPYTPRTRVRLLMMQSRDSTMTPDQSSRVGGATCQLSARAAPAARTVPATQSRTRRIEPFTSSPPLGPGCVKETGSQGAVCAASGAGAQLGPQDQPGWELRNFSTAETILLTGHHSSMGCHGSASPRAYSAPLKERDVPGKRTVAIFARQRIAA